METEYILEFEYTHVRSDIAVVVMAARSRAEALVAGERRCLQELATVLGPASQPTIVSRYAEARPAATRQLFLTACLEDWE